jgi:hypothetical protein
MHWSAVGEELGRGLGVRWELGGTSQPLHSTRSRVVRVRVPGIVIVVEPEGCQKNSTRLIEFSYLAKRRMLSESQGIQRPPNASHESCRRVRKTNSKEISEAQDGATKPKPCAVCQICRPSDL